MDKEKRPFDKQDCPRRCLVAEFADGSRQRFYADTEAAALEQITKAADECGDVAWYDGVTDENYEHGIYYMDVPDNAPHIEVLDVSNAGAIPEEIREIMQMFMTPRRNHRPS